MAHNFVGWRHQ